MASEIKNKYTILAPHPDDEFIGCRQLILANYKDINNVIFLTNGDWSIYGFPEPSVAYQRRKESSSWLKTHCPHVNIHYLNVPEIMTYGYLKGNHYGHELFIKENGMNRLDYLIDQIGSIADEDIVVSNAPDSHPTHNLLYKIMQQAYSRKYVTYHIQHTFKPSETQMPGIYEQTIADPTSFGAYLNIVVLTLEEYEKKQKEFQIYYSSQYEDFQKSGLKFYPHEMYLSSDKLNLEIK